MRPPASVRQTEGMSNDDKSKESPVTATPEWLAKQAVTFAENGEIGLVCASGEIAAHVPIQYHPGREDTVCRVRAWLAEQINGAYEAGEKAGYCEALRNLGAYIARCKAAMAKDEEKARRMRDELATLTARIDASACEVVALSEATHVLANEAPR